MATSLETTDTVTITWTTPWIVTTEVSFLHKTPNCTSPCEMMIYLTLSLQTCISMKTWHTIGEDVPSDANMFAVSDVHGVNWYYQISANKW